MIKQDEHILEFVRFPFWLQEFMRKLICTLLASLDHERTKLLKFRLRGVKLYFF